MSAELDPSEDSPPLEPGGDPSDHLMEKRIADIRKDMTGPDLLLAARDIALYGQEMPPSVRTMLLSEIMDTGIRRLSNFDDFKKNLQRFGTFSDVEILEAACASLEKYINEIARYTGRNAAYRFDPINAKLLGTFPLLDNPAYAQRLRAAFKNNLALFASSSVECRDADYCQNRAKLLGCGLTAEDWHDANALALDDTLETMLAHLRKTTSRFYVHEFESTAMELGKRLPAERHPMDKILEVVRLLLRGDGSGLLLAKSFGVDASIIHDEALSYVRSMLGRPENVSGRWIHWATSAMRRKPDGNDPGYGIDVAELAPEAGNALKEIVRLGRSSVALALVKNFKLDTSILNGEDMKNDVRTMFERDLEDGGQRPGAPGETMTVLETFGIALPSDWYRVGRIDALHELMDERALEALLSNDFGVEQAFRKDFGSLPSTFEPSEKLGTAARAHMLASIREGHAYNIEFERWCGALPRRKTDAGPLPIVEEAPAAEPQAVWDAEGWLQPDEEQAVHDDESRLDILESEPETPHTYSTEGDVEYERAVMDGLHAVLERSIHPERLMLRPEESANEVAGGFLLRCDAPLDYLKRAEVREPAIAAAMAMIARGRLDGALSLAQSCDFTIDVRSKEAQAASVAGVKRLMDKSSPEKAMEFAREMSMSDERLAKACAELIADGGLKKVLNALDVLPGKTLARLEQEWFLSSFRDDLGLPCVSIYEEYARIKKSGDIVALEGYVHKQRTIIDGLISGTAQSRDIVNMPNYRELIEMTFPRHAGHWGTFDGAESCPDRTADIDRFVVRPGYNFTLTPGADMTLREGETINGKALNAMQEPIAAARDRCERTGFDQTAMIGLVDDDLRSHANAIQPADAFGTREEKIFGLLLALSVGRTSVSDVKPLMVLYQFAAFDDIRSYLEGTRGRSEQAKNPEYAYLLELREFFSDRIKDVARHVCNTALKNPAIAALLPEYFRIKSEKERERLQRDEINKLQIPKLGMAEGFVAQIKRTLEGRTQRAWTDDEVRTLVRDYEDRTEGLAADVPEDATIDKAVYGQIRKQRRATVQALSVLGGTDVRPDQIHLGEIDLGQLLEQKRQMAAGEYDEELFTAYLTQSIQNVFAGDVRMLDTEIAKYVPKDVEKTGAKVRRVEAIITKNHTSAHARATAGVCVASDNPNEQEAENGPCIWNMPNYLQMVLRDAESKVCQGAVLMHVEEDRGKKILTASMNPSSTYLHQVNETEMFAQLRAKLAEFARDNGFDAVAMSREAQIRTNRTGGEFERAMNACIAAENKEHAFDRPRMFATNPQYMQTVVDIIWSRDGATFNERRLRTVEQEQDMPAANPWA